MPHCKRAVVTLLTSDNYLPGALTTINSLLDVEDARLGRFETVCLVATATVSHATIKALEKAFDRVLGVELITTTSWYNLDLLGRRDLAAALTKLHVFRLVEYERIVFLDADTLVLRPISRLFNEDRFSAVPDIGWPDSFNSGVMVLSPSLGDYNALIHMMHTRGSWDGADQGLLNDYFQDWNRLSFTFNVTPTPFYTHVPAYQKHSKDISILHFIGKDKPWMSGSRQEYMGKESAKDYHAHVHKWFDVYERHFGRSATFRVVERVVEKPVFTSQPTPAAPTRVMGHTPFQPKIEDLPFKAFTRPAPPIPLPLLSPEMRHTPHIEPQPQNNSQHTDFQRLEPKEHVEHVHQEQTSRQQHEHRLQNQKVPEPEKETQGHLQEPEYIPEKENAKESEPHMWDPAKSAPPKDHLQMSKPFDEHYDNAWDHKEQDKPFEAPKVYPPPPKETHEWYKETITVKKQAALKPIFPWEEPKVVKKRLTTESWLGIPLPPLVNQDRAKEVAQKKMIYERPVSHTTRTFANFNESFVNEWDRIPGITNYIRLFSGKASDRPFPTQPKKEQQVSYKSSPAKKNTKEVSRAVPGSVSNVSKWPAFRDSYPPSPSTPGASVPLKAFPFPPLVESRPLQPFDLIPPKPRMPYQWTSSLHERRPLGTPDQSDTSRDGDDEKDRDQDEITRELQKAIYRKKVHSGLFPPKRMGFGRRGSEFSSGTERTLMESSSPRSSSMSGERNVAQIQQFDQLLPRPRATRRFYESKDPARLKAEALETLKRWASENSASGSI